jgi:hypothetical protein
MRNSLDGYTMRHVLTSIGLLLAAVGAAAAQAPSVPKFADFKVDSTFRGPIAPVDVTSGAAHEFRTVLRAGARSGPNFAGHFTVVRWGCGTNCIVIAVVDAATGHVYIWPGTAGYGVEYQRDSRLLILDRWGGCLPQNAVAPDTALFMQWTGSRLRRVAAVSNRQICAP